MSDENNTDNVPVVNVHAVNLSKIFQKLSDVLTYQTYPAGKRFRMSEKQHTYVYMIRSGSISLSRQPGDILVELIQAPTIRGVIPSYSGTYVIKLIEEAEIAIIDTEQFYQYLTEHTLWEPFARHVQHLAAIGAETMYKLSAASAFDIVRTQLYELMSKPLHIRENITAENYISSKTRLSRSAIFRVIADLRTGDYIVVENGILKEIKSIPSGY